MEAFIRRRKGRIPTLLVPEKGSLTYPRKVLFSEHGKVILSFSRILFGRKEILLSGNLIYPWERLSFQPDITLGRKVIFS
jgi:hypothetical protein